MSDTEKEFEKAMRALSWKTIHNEAEITWIHDAAFAHVEQLTKEKTRLFEAGQNLTQEVLKLEQGLAALKARIEGSPLIALSKSGGVYTDIVDACPENEPYTVVFAVTVDSSMFTESPHQRDVLEKHETIDMRELTIEEAQAAYDAAESIPISVDERESIVRRVLEKAVKIDRKETDDEIERAITESHMAQIAPFIASRKVKVKC